jgi:hypothetical protein
MYIYIYLYIFIWVSEIGELQNGNLYRHAYLQTHM